MSEIVALFGIKLIFLSLENLKESIEIATLYLTSRNLVKMLDKSFFNSEISLYLSVGSTSTNFLIIGFNSISIPDILSIVV